MDEIGCSVCITYPATFGSYPKKWRHNDFYQNCDICDICDNGNQKGQTLEPFADFEVVKGIIPK